MDIELEDKIFCHITSIKDEVWEYKQVVMQTI
jgi:hypothetical protein